MGGGRAELEWEGDQASRGARVREFTIADPDGGRPITGVLWSGATSRPGMPLVCYGHGASGDRHQRPIPRLASRLAAERGYFGLALDGPVHGRRQVGPGGRAAFWPEWEREGTVEAMTRDWRTALAAVTGLREVGEGPVGYWGLSMGTIYGAPFVAAEPRISCAVLGLMGLVSKPPHYAPTIRAAAAAIRCPVFFLWQLEDELFSRAECLTLFDAFAAPDKQLHANPGLHSAVPVEELDHGAAFLASVLEGGRRGDRQVMAGMSE